MKNVYGIKAYFKLILVYETPLQLKFKITKQAGYIYYLVLV